MPGARELLKSTKGAIDLNMGFRKIILTETSGDRCARAIIQVINGKDLKNR